MRIAQASEPRGKVGRCILDKPEIGQLVEDSLLHFQNERYSLFAWVIMPNHVHIVVAPFAEHLLSNILHSWKSFTSKKINSIFHRKGSIWESESFDHLIRNVSSFDRFVEYVEANPVAAGLCAKPEDWPLSSARYRSHTGGSGV
jgi:REP element-mobilizing transposase RayT